MAKQKDSTSAREKMFDPAFQKSFTEAIHKENDIIAVELIRMKWNLQYGPRFRVASGVKWDEDPESSDEEGDIICLFDSQLEKRMPSKEERAWPASTITDTRTVPRVQQPPNVMKPVDKESKQLLYHGISHDGEGRALYLNHRYKKTPMERFHFPIISSWEYGWDYGQNESFYCPKHG